MRSDFVVLLAAPAEWNAALVGKDEIQLMKKGAGLVCLTDPQIFRWEELVPERWTGAISNILPSICRAIRRRWPGMSQPTDV